ncbi:MAG TPA: hypothetical protein DCK95_09225 [Anaerolineaceae bacterium]|nr:hypothetical protein [Anaerolineaceae bacterium]
MLRIVMDTAGDLCSGWQQEYDIDLIPINIIHNGVSYQQGIDIRDEEFYKIIEKEGTVPSTSQPTPYQFVEFYKKIAEPGDDILSIHITNKLSGTMLSARQAAEELKGTYNIYPFDSASGTIGMGMLCKEARVLERSGFSLNDILGKLDAIRKNMAFFFTLDTLKFAQLSGRVKSLQAILASLLDIKPILEVQDGTIETIDKVRTRKASIEKVVEKMKDKIGDQPVKIAVGHVRNETMAEMLLEQVKKTFNCVEVMLTDVSITLATHFGPGALGLVAYPA